MDIAAPACSASLVSLFVVPLVRRFPGAVSAAADRSRPRAVLGAGAGLTSRSLLPLTNPVSQYVGKISYSLYLWHFPVVVLIVTVVASVLGRVLARGAWR